MRRRASTYAGVLLDEALEGLHVEDLALHELLGERVQEIAVGGQDLDRRVVTRVDDVTAGSAGLRAGQS